MKVILYTLLSIVLVQSYQCREQANTADNEQETVENQEETAIATRSTIETRNFICRGNEPFWNVEIEPDSGILYNSMNEGKTQFPYVKPDSSGDTLVYETSTEDGTTMTITIRKSTCMDSMSGKEYAYESTIEIKDKTLQGCAEARE